jgi:hypothetical protein
MDTPKAIDVSSSFEAIWNKMLSEKNICILNLANRILAGYTTPADPSPGKPTLMYWEASPRARWTNVVGGTGSLVFAVKDTAKFQVAERFVWKRLYYNGATYVIVPHLCAKIPPQCSKCHVWGHHETICRAKNRFCEICSNAHSTALHNEHCIECAAEAFVSDTPAPAVCPCTGSHMKCANCSEKGHGPRSKDCCIFKMRMDACFMKNFAPAIRQGTRVQNTRTKGGVIQAEAERDRLTCSDNAIVTGVSIALPPGITPRTNLKAYLARWAQLGLCIVGRPIRAVPFTSSLHLLLYE